MRHVRTVLQQSVAVAICGLLLALAANAVSPRGLKLSRNYFPEVQLPTAPGTRAPQHAAAGTGTNESTDVLERLRVKGLRGVETKAAVDVYHSPEYQQGLAMFIDARDDDHYLAGHIPGAHQLDYYRPEGHLPTVLPLAQIANRIVVYCNGGNCEDSEFAALLLKNAGVPELKLEIYVGGFADWKSNGLPVEVGMRMSGNIVTNSLSAK